MVQEGLACEQALCLRKGWKKCEEREGKGGEPIDKHLGSQHMTFTSCQNAAFSNELFSLAGRLCSGRFSCNWANVFFAAFFILWGRDTYIDFLRLLFLVDVICPLMQEHFIWALLKRKALHCEAHQSSARRRHLKDQKTCLRTFIQIACYVPTKKAM